MPSNQTPNYQLSQWEAGDRVQRTDFNADNAKIDAAIKAVDAKVPRIHTGTYTGTGEYGVNKPNSLTFPFVPKLVIIVGAMAEGNSLGTVLIYGQTVSGGIGVSGSSTSTLNLTVVWSGKTVSWYTSGGNAERQLNRNNTTYHYFLLG